MKLSSYPSVYALGHAAIANLFEGNVVIQEKIDGSQFSWMKDEQGNLHFRSHHAEIYDGDNSMFYEGVQAVKAVADKLKPNWVYRGEYLRKPKHNVLCYSRVPKNHIYLFDINTGLEQYRSFVFVEQEATFLGFEPVKMIYAGEGSKVDFEFLKSMLNEESILGGTKIEGLVIKNYEQFGKDKHCLMGKWVKEEMKERISKGGGKSGGKDIIQTIGLSLKTEARWQKAIQHLFEQGLLLNEPKDIGLLLKEINLDTLKEETDYIKEKLFKWAWPNISRIVTAGFPEFYKELLAKKQFENKDLPSVDKS